MFDNWNENRRWAILTVVALCWGACYTWVGHYHDGNGNIVTSPRDIFQALPFTSTAFTIIFITSLVLLWRFLMEIRWEVYRQPPRHHYWVSGILVLGALASLHEFLRQQPWTLTTWDLGAILFACLLPVALLLFYLAYEEYVGVLMSPHRGDAMMAAARAEWSEEEDGESNVAWLTTFRNPDSASVGTLFS